MKGRELWDAVDREGRLLGFDLVREEPIPEGVCHRVVLILTVTDRGNILITQRHPDKIFGLMWEVSGGAVLKGEEPLHAAGRELREETGITVRPEDLHLVCAHSEEGAPSYYYEYMTPVREEGLSIRLQEGETVDWRLISYGDFKAQLRMGEGSLFPVHVCRRLLKYESAFDRCFALLTAPQK